MSVGNLTIAHMTRGIACVCAFDNNRINIQITEPNALALHRAYFVSFGYESPQLLQRFEYVVTTDLTDQAIVVHDRKAAVTLF